MFILLAIVYGTVIVLVAGWIIKMFQSNRHFRTAIQHPSLSHHIQL